MDEIKVFENVNFGSIRMTGTYDQPLFCLVDLCKVLDLTNPTTVKNRLDPDDVQLIDFHALNYTEGGIYGNTKANFVTESGFYDVILQSKSSKAKPFRRWVTKDILPSIRKNGGYVQVNDDDSDIEIFYKALKIAEKHIADKDRQIRKLKENIIKQEEIIDTQRPKVEYFDDLVAWNASTNYRTTAKQLGIKQKNLIGNLVEMGYIYRDNNGNLMPYAKYVPELFVIKDFVSNNGYTGQQSRITTKGKETFRLLMCK